jgi:hypothetical protein
MTHFYIPYTTHTLYLVGCRASPPPGWEVHSSIWLSIDEFSVNTAIIAMIAKPENAIFNKLASSQVQD